MMTATQPWLTMVVETIYALYRTELHREPDMDGLAGWLWAAFCGATYDSMLAAFRASAEYHALHDVKPMPPPPTRDQILSARGSFQGLTVDTQQYGRLPWFDPFLGSLALPADRQAVYAAKLAAGQRRLTLALSYAYREAAPNVYQNIPGRDFSKDLPALHALMVEAIMAGCYIDLRLAGDGRSRPDRTYNDPVGDTYGCEWLFENAARIHAALADLDPYIVWVPGFDGVFCKPNYPWTPDEVKRWWLLMRSLVGPSGYVGIEWGVGICDLGDGEATYRSAAGQALDVVYLELPCPPSHTGAPKPGGDGYDGDDLWQVAKRLLGPAYRRPADQPPGDDPGSMDSRLSCRTPRGPFYVLPDEFRTYDWVRNRCTAADVEQDRAYFASLGFPHLG